MSDNKAQYKYVISLRFKGGNKAYTFGTDDETIEYGDYLVVETSQGLELGECISSLRDSSTFVSDLELKPVLRKADEKDHEEFKYNEELAKEAMEFCESKVEELGLDMRLISSEYTLDRTKILFVYLADERVDFRELLKHLAAHLKCRIELKQIGARDRSKLIGGIGVCGMECCCSRFLNKFDIISINMAKNQLLALNIPKLSGQCGKLMCCLKFEDDEYKEVVEGLPRLNSKVEYNNQIFTVASINPILDDIKLQNPDQVINVTSEELMKNGIFFKPIVIKKKQKNVEAKPIEKEDEQKEDNIKKEKIKKQDIKIEPEKEKIENKKKFKSQKSKKHIVKKVKTKAKPKTEKRVFKRK